jgi:hypothetical protein
VFLGQIGAELTLLCHVDEFVRQDGGTGGGVDVLRYKDIAARGERPSPERPSAGEHGAPTVHDGIGDIDAMNPPHPLGHITRHHRTRHHRPPSRDDDRQRAGRPLHGPPRHDDRQCRPLCD